MSKKEQLLAAAEVRVRQGGYNNFSFRELADDIGIKSSSVHYHFPTKADMAEALAERYTENFLTALGTPESIINSGKNPIEEYIAQFKRALTDDKLMCLCGLLAAESAMLPAQVKNKTKVFFERNIEWLTRSISLHTKTDDATAYTQALRILAQLEGAMLMSQIMDDDALFTVITQRLTQVA